MGLKPAETIFYNGGFRVSVFQMERPRPGTTVRACTRKGEIVDVCITEPIRPFAPIRVGRRNELVDIEWHCGSELVQTDRSRSYGYRTGTYDPDPRSPEDMDLGRKY